MSATFKLPFAGVRGVFCTPPLPPPAQNRTFVFVSNTHTHTQVPWSMKYSVYVYEGKEDTKRVRVLRAKLPGHSNTRQTTTAQQGQSWVSNLSPIGVWTFDAGVGSRWRGCPFHRPQPTLTFGSYVLLASLVCLVPQKVKAGGAAVLSCPAYFSDVQRDVMAAAGGDAGLTVLDTIDEPVVREKERERERESRSRFISSRTGFRFSVACFSAVPLAGMCGPFSPLSREWLER